MDARRGDQRITGLAALATALLMLPGVAVGALHPVPVAADSASLVAHLAAHRQALLASLFFAALGWTGVLCIFASGLYALLRRAEGGSGIWSRVAFGACLATAVAIGVALTLWAVVVFRAPAIEPALAAVLYDAGAIANLMTAFPNAVYAGAAAVVIGRTSVLPHWIGAGAWAVVIIHLLSALSVARTGAFSPWGVLPSLAPLAHTAWLAGIAAVLLRR